MQIDLPEEMLAEVKSAYKHALTSARWFVPDSSYMDGDEPENHAHRVAYILGVGVEEVLDWPTYGPTSYDHPVVRPPISRSEIITHDLDILSNTTNRRRRDMGGYDSRQERTIRNANLPSSRGYH